MLIAANRRRPNLGEFIKPTIPRRFVNHGPFLEPGSHPCEGARIEPCKKRFLGSFVNMSTLLKCWYPPGREETGQFVRISAVPKTTLFI